MTHPMIEAVAARLSNGSVAHDPAKCEYCADTAAYYQKRAADLVAEVLRLAREPSEMMDTAMYRQCVEGLRGTPDEVWRAGIDALLREVEG